jgi:hypothetical protein
MFSNIKPLLIAPNYGTFQERLNLFKEATTSPPQAKQMSEKSLIFN